MSYFESLKKLKNKIIEKNIILINGNVDDLFPVDLDQTTYKQLFAHQNKKNQLCNLPTYLKELLISLDFEKVHFFNPAQGYQVFDENGDLITTPSAVDNRQSEVADEFADDEDANNPSTNGLSFADFILKINDNLRVYLQTTMGKPISEAYVVDLSDYLIVNNSQELTYIQLGILVNAFLNNFNRTQMELLTNNFKLILISRNPNLFNQLAFNQNVEFINYQLLLPNHHERTQFLKTNWHAFRCNESKINELKVIEAANLTDSMNFRKMFQLMKVSKHVQATDFKSLYRLIMFDKYESEWEKLDLARLNTLDATLNQVVKGQQNAVAAIKKAIIRSRVGLQGANQTSSVSAKPKGILFFAGPTGVGKTELAKQLTEFVFGDQSKFIRFDMSEYNHEHSDQRLIGAPPGYVGYENGGQLTNAVKEKPFCILLFDEIEKAHSKIWDKFLQVLEDGRLTSSQGETIDFSETFIIFTSNIGATNTSPNDGDEVNHEKYLSAIQTYFKDELKRPEVLNRIGLKNVVVFNFIQDYQIIKEIIAARLNQLASKLSKEKKINMVYADYDVEQLVALINKRYDKTMGGRGLLNSFEEFFIDELSNFIFVNSLLPKPDQETYFTIGFEVANKKVVFTQKNK